MAPKTKKITTVKKIFLTILSFAALLGCSEGDTVTPANPGAISFGNVSTRAGLSDLQANGFGVWAVFVNEAQPTGYWLLDNERVYLNDGNWTYDNPQLWVSNSLFGFFACYPQDAGFEKDEANLAVSMTYETPDAANEDILVATTFVDTSAEGYNETVPLTFKHLFSKVNIRVKQNKGTNERDYFIIDKITLRNVKSKGTCMAFQDVDVVWEYDTATKSFTKDIPGDDIIDFETGIMLSDEGLLLLPQTIEANSIELEVAFRVGLEGNTDISTFESKTYKTYLPNTVNWESGKSYTYTAQVSTYNPIVFLPPTVESWGGSQSGGTIIIK
jgi:hypothetical protein